MHRILHLLLILFCIPILAMEPQQSLEGAVLLLESKYQNTQDKDLLKITLEKNSFAQLNAFKEYYKTQTSFSLLKPSTWSVFPQKKPLISDQQLAHLDSLNPSMSSCKTKLKLERKQLEEFLKSLQELKWEFHINDPKQWQIVSKKLAAYREFKEKITRSQNIIKRYPMLYALDYEDLILDPCFYLSKEAKYNDFALTLAFVNDYVCPWQTLNERWKKSHSGNSLIHELCTKNLASTEFEQIVHVLINNYKLLINEENINRESPFDLAQKNNNFSYLKVLKQLNGISLINPPKGVLKLSNSDIKKSLGFAEGTK